jgi:hypothetical protein
MTTRCTSKFASIALLALATITLAACGDDESAASGAASATGSTTGTIVSSSPQTDTLSNPGSSSTSPPAPPASSTPTPPPVASTSAATVDWSPPTENVDGSTLTNLAGYKLYYGNSETNLSESVKISNPGLSSYTVSDLPSGKWYFAIASISASGVESAQSAVVTTTL